MRAAECSCWCSNSLFQLQHKHLISVRQRGGRLMIWATFQALSQDFKTEGVKYEFLCPTVEAGPDLDQEPKQGSQAQQQMYHRQVLKVKKTLVKRVCIKVHACICMHIMQVTVCNVP
ncbi:hypothetical protein GOODEAATRI_030078 [Goodea atripinnis]|uniref:Uncharacterized protein n=1 Tax=Goodea atripinnis TaxID=208336 RepID=A0ABV0MMD4_9TELE